MNKRKIRFNFIDLLLLLLIAAVVFAVLYIFVLSGRDTAQDDESTVTVQYVVEIANIDERFADAVKKGQPVQDAIQRKNVGTVVGAEAKDYEKIVFDYDSAEEVLAKSEGRITLYVTVEAQVYESDSAFTAEGVAIRVGERYSLIFPDLYGVGYCTSLKIKTEE